MARERISMTAKGVGAFLTRQHWVVLATLDPDGSPWADIVSAEYDNGKLFFKVVSNSRSVANLMRDPRVCCMNDQYPTYYEIQGVTLHGIAELAMEDQIPLALKGRPDPLNPERSSPSEVYLLSVRDVVSFDFSKITQR